MPCLCFRGSGHDKVEKRHLRDSSTGVELSFDDQLSMFGTRRGSKKSRASKAPLWSLQNRKFPPPPPPGYHDLQQLPEENVGDLQQLFNLFDEDISGTITDAELEVGLSKIGHQLDQHQLAKLIAAIDQDQPAVGQRKDGVVDFIEFSNAILAGI